MKKQTLLLMLLAACLLSLAIASGADAQEVEQVGRYYSDNTYTTQIGGKIFDCCGGVVTWGYYSTYQIWEQEPCNECFPHSPCHGDPYCEDPYHPASSSSLEQTREQKLRAITKRLKLPEGTVLRFGRTSRKACTINAEMR